MLIPVLWIIIFFISNVVWDLDSGIICIFLWIALPIIMFIFNTFSEPQLKRLALLYLISSLAQILGIFIDVALYYNFICGDPETPAVGLLIILLTAILNLILSLIGIGIKGLILRFKKN